MTQRTFIRFYHPGYGSEEGQIVEALGSDAWHRVDGRLCLGNLMLVAEDRAKQLRKVQPHYSHYRVMKGDSLLHAKPTTRLFEIDKRNWPQD